ncbi:F-box domain-containing protein [Mycena sanguinolenta]|uniref:F-box domain-containing protein n=1 Tax=Mycena sanguinolenta TaxID=230812 RepID=A0A8H6XTF1_9AGAR|nr:F-box domain-containing protein [Mycena sanguinolenta]
MEFQMDSAHSHDRAQEWLRRAKASDGCEIIWFDEETENDTWSIPIFQTLLGHAHKLKFLELSTIPLDYIRELDRLSSSCTFPSLQKLAIGIKEEGLDDWERESMDDMPCVQLFANAPCLRELSLIGNTPPVFLGCLPWHQFTKYTGTGVYHEDCIDALRLGSNLVECALAAGGIDTDFVEILIHSSLKSLTLFENGWHLSADIFQFLTLPALETLRILDSKYEWFSDLEFVEFLRRSSPPSANSLSD